MKTKSFALGIFMMSSVAYAVMYDCTVGEQTPNGKQTSYKSFQIEVGEGGSQINVSTPVKDIYSCGSIPIAEGSSKFYLWCGLARDRQFSKPATPSISVAIIAGDKRLIFSAPREVDPLTLDYSYCDLK